MARLMGAKCPTCGGTDTRQRLKGRKPVFYNVDQRQYAMFNCKNCMDSFSRFTKDLEKKHPHQGEWYGDEIQKEAEIHKKIKAAIISGAGLSLEDADKVLKMLVHMKLPFVKRIDYRVATEIWLDK